MVGRLLLMNFMTKCAICTVVFSCASLNNIGSISSQYSVWVIFRSSHCWSIQQLEISYAIDWTLLEWIEALCIEKLVIMCGSNSPIFIVIRFADEITNSVMICYASASSCTLRDARGIMVDTGIPLFWCPWTWIRDMRDSIEWYTSDRRELRSNCFHLDFTASGWIVARLRALM